MGEYDAILPTPFVDPAVASDLVDGDLDDDGTVDVNVG